MLTHLNYPVSLTEQPEGGYLVQFIDLPEAITQGETWEDALQQAGDCLEEAIANRIEMKLDIPEPSKTEENQPCISIHATIAAKAALYTAMREQHLTNTALAKRLSCDEKEVRRLLNPYYQSKFPMLERALNVLGQRLELRIQQYKLAG